MPVSLMRQGGQRGPLAGGGQRRRDGNPPRDPRTKRALGVSSVSPRMGNGEGICRTARRKKALKPAYNGQAAEKLRGYGRGVESHGDGGGKAADPAGQGRMTRPRAVVPSRCGGSVQTEPEQAQTAREMANAAARRRKYFWREGWCGLINVNQQQRTRRKEKTNARSWLECKWNRRGGRKC